MSKEKKLLKILERFRNQLSDKEIAFIDDISKNVESVKDTWDVLDSDYSLFIDGAAEFDEDLKPNNAGIGGLINKGDELVYSFSENIGIRTNNEAEYSALIRGLEIGLELNIINIKIYADSELVVKQVSGEYKVKHERMRPLHRKAIALLSQYSNWSLQHVPRNDNTIADKLSKEGMEKGR